MSVVYHPPDVSKDKTILHKIIEVLVVILAGAMLALYGYFAHRIDSTMDRIYTVDTTAAVTEAKLTLIEAKIDALREDFREFRGEVNEKL